MADASPVVRRAIWPAIAGSLCVCATGDSTMGVGDKESGQVAPANGADMGSVGADGVSEDVPSLIGGFVGSTSGYGYSGKQKL